MYMSPLFDNVIMKDTDEGIVYIGTGAINDNDIFIKNTIVEQVISNMQLCLF